MGNGVTLVIADRDRFMVEALASVLDGQPDLEILGTAHDAKGAVEAIVDHRPAVAILDGDLAFENGENLVSRLRKMSLSTGIVFIGSRMDPTALAEFIFADPAGRAFIRKSDIGSVDKLVRTIRAVADGSTLLDDDIFRRFLTESGASQQGSMPGLTAKERQVLACIANADSNSKIAEKLNLRGRTVENYVANIFSKLGARRRSGRDPRVQAALYFLSETGRLEPDGSSANGLSHPVKLFAG
ncbi:MAG: response regulator transcription factor [Chloroflexi bacterium]|nr:response regulator transcription factor [Chloroflexota bacterium]